jgi:predicted nucleic acid-binding protein
MTVCYLVDTDWTILIGVDTCRLFGRERGRLRRQKKAIADFDLLIGATALQHDLTLLTNNRRHFELVEGLRLESQPQ